MQCLPVSVCCIIGLLFLYFSLRCSDVEDCTRYWFWALCCLTVGCHVFQEERVLCNSKNCETLDTNMNGVQFRILALTDLNWEYMQAHDSYIEKQKTVVNKIINIAGQCHWWCGTPFQAIYYPHISALVLFMWCAWNNLSLLLHSTRTAHTFLEIK